MARTQTQRKPNNIKKQPKSNKVVYLYPGPRFTEPDPELVEIRDMINKTKLPAYKISELTAKAAGGSSMKVSAPTISKWLNGDTKRPYNYTLNRVAYALGYERPWRKIGE